MAHPEMEAVEQEAPPADPFDEILKLAGEEPEEEETPPEEKAQGQAEGRVLAG